MRQTILVRHAELNSKCDCANSAAYDVCTEYSNQGPVRSLPFEDEKESVKGLEASMKARQYDIVPPRVVSSAAHCPQDVATPKRRLAEMRDGPEPWALKALSAAAPYVKPGVRAKTVVAARFGKTRIVTAAAARPTPMKVQPTPTTPNEKTDVKPHREALRRCLGLPSN